MIKAMMVYWFIGLLATIGFIVVAKLTMYNDKDD